MAEATVQCPHCHSKAVVKYGKSSNGKERFRCQQSAQCSRTFLRNYAYPDCLPTVKQQIVEMTLNGSGIRDIARVLQIGPNTGMKELKKSGRSLPGEHQCSGGVWSGRESGRSAVRGSGGGR
jgi:transposase-like protein